MRVALDLIERGDRLRGVTPEQVEAIAASMAVVGLLSPITVYPRDVVRAGIAVRGYGLVAGMHRLEAARRLGWEEIDAQVVTLPDLERQLAECDENLCGTKLTPAERALFTRRRKEIYEALHPETRQGGVGRGGYKDDNLSSFSDDTAARTGRNKRDVQRDASRGERIADDVLADIRGTDLDKGVVLDAIARADDQRAEMERIRAGAKPVPPPPPVRNDVEAEDQWLGSILRLWNKAPAQWRERFLTEVGE